MISVWEFFKANLKIFYRNKQGFFWTIFMPAGIYIALSILPISRAVSPMESYSNYLLPGIIAMTIMQTGIYGLAYWMVDLRSRGVIKRFLATPLKSWELIFGILASRMVIILLEVLILTLLGIIIFHTQFVGNILSTLVIALLGSAIFLVLGLLISNFANSYEAAAPITAAIGLPLTFLGNIFYPIDILPPVLQTVAKLLPITYLADGLRQAYLFDFDFFKIGRDVLILAVWLIIMLVILLSVFRLKED